MGLDIHTLWPIYNNLEVPVLGSSPYLIDQYETGFPPRTTRSSKLRHGKGPMKHKAFYDLDIRQHIGSQTSAEWIPEQIEDYFDALAPLMMSLC